uniref:HTH psq-type domain-containing protein n=1 Tax=Crocodylus porosus TaxID=8502 RepID=A0A7M4FTH2_CROPO
SKPVGGLTTSSGAQPKNQRSVPMLEEKLTVLDLLRDSMSVSNMAHKYCQNESSICAIRIREREIHQAMASTPGFKPAKDHVTMLSHNVAGHLI